MIHIFCFYNESSGVQAGLAFSNVFRHCNIISFDGEDWTAVEFDLKGYHFRRIMVNRASSLIRGLKYIDSIVAIIAVDVPQKISISWKPFVVRSCNEIDRYISGVDIGFTFNPKHLYTKLLKYDKCKNYDVLYQWRR